MEIIKEKSELKKIINGSILSPLGYKAGGVHAGLRYTKKDLGIILSEVPASCAAVYTKNIFNAAPLQVTKNSISIEKKLQAIIVNSACANACTGKRGLEDAYEMRSSTSKAFGISEHLVAVASTGVIGEFLDMQKIKQGINLLNPVAETCGAADFETAILTTDTVTKNTAYSTYIDGVKVTAGGAAKGSGMIHPNMATMLGFVTTDANISSDALQSALSMVTNQTFNQITVDGDTSTNDMVIVMANGQAGNKVLDENHPEWQKFIELLKLTSEELAKQIARDGEGATRLIEVNVSGCRTNEDAQMAAKTIVGSNLVKTAVFGADGNWGRVIAAMGRSGITFNPEDVTICFGETVVLNHSEPVSFSEETVTDYLKKDSVVINVLLEEGKGAGTAWGCDLTYDYVKINGSYRS
ncbi:glutamate N-acetyltransferase/amino-acid N-acetyltransferase [Peribacillus deserti]|uniref:Arginine biosynthesis bifunctional protein ArgJ n=1 Tax=Peribacillus deserti TaxID=673318 RepID=A0ABS2QLC9_9BACI|nr:bifunctional ornithine acetyltransferase/N-acetylglutamate synthase [Peribacillus deserti]MBM7693976.1 glutamate N-acetyltransferase/amino-acid N-acetyltransferase [Peribacillus deserti]